MSTVGFFIALDLIAFGLSDKPLVTGLVLLSFRLCDFITTSRGVFSQHLPTPFVGPLLVFFDVFPFEGQVLPLVSYYQRVVSHRRSLYTHLD